MSQACLIKVALPFTGFSAAASSDGTSGSRFGKAFDSAQSTNTAISKRSSGCCVGILPSIVTKISNCCAAAVSRSPFLSDFQPMKSTVRTSCPAMWCRNRMFTHSSSRIRILTGQSGKLGLGGLKHGHDLLTADARETFHEVLKAFAGPQGVKQIAHRHTRTGEAKFPAHDVGVALGNPSFHEGNVPRRGDSASPLSSGALSQSLFGKPHPPLGDSKGGHPFALIGAQHTTPRLCAPSLREGGEGL